MTTTPRLISFKLCPFVQRPLIVLGEKNVAHDVTYIELSNKPDWFLKLSPRGRVPVLDLGTASLFESQAICEYLDEAFPQTQLMPKDLVHRARDRAWFPFAGEDLFAGMYQLVHAKADGLAAQKQKLEASLTRLEQEMQGRDYLSGDGTKFGMADVAFAPFFTRASLLKKAGGPDLLAGHPQLAKWGERLLARESVKKSVPPDFEALFNKSLEGIALMAR